MAQGFADFVRQKQPQTTPPQSGFAQFVQQQKGIAPRGPEVPQETPQPDTSFQVSQVPKYAALGTKEVAKALTSSTRAFGKTAGEAFALSGQIKELEGLNAKEFEQGMKLIKAMRENKAKGKDNAKLMETYRQLTGKLPSIEELNPTINTTTGQVLGQAAGTILEATAAGKIVKGAKAGQLAKGALPEALSAAETVSKYTPKAEATIKAGKAVAAGAAQGYAYDVSQNLQQGKTGTEALKPGLGTVVGTAIPAVTGAYGVAKAGKTVDKVVDAIIDESISKAVKPSNTKKTLSQALTYKGKAREGVKAIVANKEALRFIDDAGEEVTGRVPQSLNEATQAIDQTKKLVFQKYDALDKAAGKVGARVYLDAPANELLTVARSPVLQDNAPDAAQYAFQKAQNLMQRKFYTAEQAQEAIQLYNQSLKSFYRNPTADTATKAYIDSLVVNNLRKNLDTVIESATGSEYQALKNQYSALKAIEADFNRAATRVANRNPKGLLDFADIFSAGDVLKGIATFNPAQTGKGLFQLGIKSLIKRANDPDRIIKNMFEQVDNAFAESAAAGVKAVPDIKGKPMLNLPEPKDKTFVSQVHGQGVIHQPSKVVKPGTEAFKGKGALSREDIPLTDQVQEFRSPIKNTFLPKVRKVAGRALDALNESTPGLSTKAVRKRTITYVDENGKRQVLKNLSIEDAKNWTAWLQDKGLKYTVKAAGLVGLIKAIKHGSSYKSSER